VLLVEEVTVPVDVVISPEDGGSCGQAGNTVMSARLNSAGIHVDCRLTILLPILYSYPKAALRSARDNPAYLSRE
jgi:hypothetical protein